jgi:hypothetical protein
MGGNPVGRYLSGLVIVMLAGCGGGGGPKLYPVRGTVLFQDQPAAGATVVFHPVAATNHSTPKPSGVVKPDGTFTLTTHPHGDGAPAGEYVVVVTWYGEGARSVENPVSKLPARYADGQASPLKATVKDGPTELEPFKLTK